MEHHDLDVFPIPKEKQLSSLSSVHIIHIFSYKSTGEMSLRNLTLLLLSR